MNVDSEKESNAVVLMNDCIHNYITVASFANNGYISSKYISMGDFLKSKKDISEVQDYYTSVYAIFIGTYAIAQQGAFAPSSSKAFSAYKKIFGIIDNTLNNDEQKESQK